MQACPLLLDSALLPFVADTLVKGFEAFVAHESAVYQHWVRDKANPRVGVGGRWLVVAGCAAK